MERRRSGEEGTRKPRKGDERKGRRKGPTFCQMEDARAGSLLAEDTSAMILDDRDNQWSLSQSRGSPVSCRSELFSLLSQLMAAPSSFFPPCIVILSAPPVCALIKKREEKISSVKSSTFSISCFNSYHLLFLPRLRSEISSPPLCHEINYSRGVKYDLQGDRYNLDFNQFKAME